jgi:hypothetical protein
MNNLYNIVKPKEEVVELTYGFDDLKKIIVANKIPFTTFPITIPLLENVSKYKHLFLPSFLEEEEVIIEGPENEEIVTALTTDLIPPIDPFLIGSNIYSYPCTRKTYEYIESMAKISSFTFSCVKVGDDDDDDDDEHSITSESTGNDSSQFSKQQIGGKKKFGAFSIRILPIVYCGVYKLDNKNNINYDNNSLDSSMSSYTNITSLTSGNTKKLLSRNLSLNQESNLTSEVTCFNKKDDIEWIVNFSITQGASSQLLAPVDPFRVEPSLQSQVEYDEDSDDDSGMSPKKRDSAVLKPIRSLPFKRGMALSKAVEHDQRLTPRNNLKWLTQTFLSIHQNHLKYIVFNGDIDINDIYLISDSCMKASIKEVRANVEGSGNGADMINDKSKIWKEEAEKDELLRSITGKPNIINNDRLQLIRYEEEELLKLRNKLGDRDAWIDPDRWIKKAMSFKTIHKSIYYDDTNDENPDLNLNLYINDPCLNPPSTLLPPFRYNHLVRRLDRQLNNGYCKVAAKDDKYAVKCMELYEHYSNNIYKDMRAFGITVAQLLMKEIFQPTDKLYKQMLSENFLFNDFVDATDDDNGGLISRISSELVNLLKICFVKVKKPTMAYLHGGWDLNAPYLSKCQEVLYDMLIRAKFEEAETKFVKPTYWTKEDERRRLKEKNMRKRDLEDKAIEGVETAGERNKAYAEQVWFDMQPESVKESIITRREKAELDAKKRRRNLKYLKQASFHCWDADDSCKWFNDAMVKCMKDGLRLRIKERPPVIEVKGLYGIAAIKAAEATAKREAAEKEAKSTDKESKSRESSPSKATRENTAASNSTRNNTVNAVGGSSQSLRGKTSKGNEKKHVKLIKRLNIFEDLRLNELLMPLQPALKKILSKGNIPCYSNRHESTDLEIDIDYENAIIEISKRISFMITDRFDNLRLCDCFYEAIELGKIKIEKSVIFSMLPPAQYKAKKTGIEASYLSEGKFKNFLIEIFSTYANYIGVLDITWNKKMIYLTCFSLMERYHECEHLRKEGERIAAELFRSAFQRNKITAVFRNIWKRAQHEYNQLLRDEAEEKRLRIESGHPLPGDITIIAESGFIIDNFGRKIKQDFLNFPTVFPATGGDKSISVLVEMDLTQSNYGGVNSGRKDIECCAVIVKDATPLPFTEDSTKELKIAVLNSHETKSSEKININLDSTEKNDPTGEIILIVYDSRQSSFLPRRELHLWAEHSKKLKSISELTKKDEDIVTEERKKYAGSEVFDINYIQGKVDYLGPKPHPWNLEELRNNRKKLEQGEELEVKKDLDIDQFNLIIPTLLPFRKYRIRVLYVDLFHPLQQIERDLNVRYSLKIPKVIYFAGDVVKAKTNTSTADVPVIIGSEVVFSAGKIQKSNLEIEEEEKNSVKSPKKSPLKSSIKSPVKEEIIKKVKKLFEYKVYIGVAGLHNVTAAVRIQWDKVISNGSSIIDYTIQRRILLIACDNKELDNNNFYNTLSNEQIMSKSLARSQEISFNDLNIEDDNIVKGRWKRISTILSPSLGYSDVINIPDDFENLLIEYGQKELQKEKELSQYFGVSKTLYLKILIQHRVKSNNSIGSSAFSLPSSSNLSTISITAIPDALYDDESTVFANTSPTKGKMPKRIREPHIGVGLESSAHITLVKGNKTGSHMISSVNVGLEKLNITPEKEEVIVTKVDDLEVSKDKRNRIKRVKKLFDSIDKKDVNKDIDFGGSYELTMSSNNTKDLKTKSNRLKLSQSQPLFRSNTAELKDKELQDIIDNNITPEYWSKRQFEMSCVSPTQSLAMLKIESPNKLEYQWNGEKRKRNIEIKKKELITGIKSDEIQIDDSHIEYNRIPVEELFNEPRTKELWWNKEGLEKDNNEFSNNNENYTNNNNNNNNTLSLENHKEERKEVVDKEVETQEEVKEDDDALDWLSRLSVACPLNE